jgi:hypothetical protein
MAAPLAGGSLILQPARLLAVFVLDANETRLVFPLEK